MSYDAINTLFLLLSNYDTKSISSLLPDEKYKTQFNDFIKNYQNTFEIQELLSADLHNFQNNIFKKGQSVVLDSLQQEMNHYNEIFKQLAKRLSSYIEPNSNLVKTEYNEIVGYHFQLTSKRADKLNKMMAKVKTIKLSKR